MDQNSNLNYNEPIYSIESFNSLLDDMNKSSFTNQLDQKIDESDIQPDKDLLTLKSKSHLTDINCLEKISCYIVLSIFLLFLAISFLLIYLSIISLIFDTGISFYSVLIMNYVFFISAIVSYIMAPIYQALSGDWINFVFSLIQVILASPLIAFFIFYILKSVKSLGSFISEIKNEIKKIFLIVIYFIREFFLDSIIDLLNYDLDCLIIVDSLKFLIFLIFLILIFAFCVGLTYVLFCFDKTIIMLGLICYIATTIQIFIIISPSYLYFFQTLLNIKCKEAKYVIKYIKFANYYIPNYSDELEYYKSQEKKDNQSESIDSISNKLIDDPYIRGYINNDDKAVYNLMSLITMLFQLVTVESYYSIFYYSKTIAFDKHKKCRKIVLMNIFFILNLSVIIYDIYKLTQNYSAFYLASVIIRILIFPLLCYYNVFIIIFYRSKDKVLNFVLIVASILTIIIVIAIICCYQFTDFYQHKYRINDLNYSSILDNYTIANPNILNHPICTYDIFGVSPIDAFGYSLGGYDFKRNFTIFDNQMKFFFGANYNQNINYKIHEINENFYFIQYHDSLINTTIFGFRGFNSGPEVAFQLEVTAAYYIIPFFADIVPFYEFINEYWLSFYTDFLNSFGLSFFENGNLMIKYVNSIIDIYNKEQLDNDDRVLFAGINTGGLISKIVGTILKRKSISFISFPIDNDLLNTMFDFSPFYLSLVTNVYNVDGFFSDQESGYATNIGISIPAFDEKKYCTSGVCEIISRADKTYRTFCTMTEMCGKGNQFNDYCKKVIGENDLETIREKLKENI